MRCTNVSRFRARVPRIDSLRERVMHSLRYSINVTLEGRCDHRGIGFGRRNASSRRGVHLWMGGPRDDGERMVASGSEELEA